MDDRITVRINGTDVAVAADPRSSLLDVLREDCGLTGTKNGCSTGECGACTVLVDGQPRCACLTPAGVGGAITTIEGLRADPVGEELIDAFAREGAVQCGFCSPGMVTAAWAGLACGLEPVESLRGNLCRCTGYKPILAAVARVATRPVVPTDVRAVEASADGRFVVPATLTEAVAAIREPSVLVGGGTSLMAAGLLDGHRAVWIGGLAELRTIGRTAPSLWIGGAVTWTRLRADPTVARLFPALAQAAAGVGGPQIQFAGTLGGNLAAAAPGADGFPPLAVHDAEVELMSATGTRRVRLTELVKGPGESVISCDEILTRVLLPIPARPRFEFFVKAGPRKGNAMIDKITIAVSAVREGDRLHDVRIALGAAGPTVLRATEAEQVLADGRVTPDRIAAAATAAEAIADPIDDVRETAAYRRRLVRGVLVRELTQRLQG